MDGDSDEGSQLYIWLRIKSKSQKKSEAKMLFKAVFLLTFETFSFSPQKRSTNVHHN